MSTTQEPPVARPRKPLPSTRFDIRVDPDWLARIERQAARFGMATAAYIRQGATEKLERDEATQPPPPKGRPAG